MPHSITCMVHMVHVISILFFGQIVQSDLRQARSLCSIQNGHESKIGKLSHVPTHSAQCLLETEKQGNPSYSTL
jgi:hypothetical protein